ncbi:MAG: hypothetical protein K0S81_758, partial [Rhodospirillales bacterium]|nr:hypothetical protein [Rhodospirillales bacterium]
MRRSLAAALCLAATFAVLPADAHAQSDAPLCDYDVVLLDQEGWSLDVAIECRRPVEGFGFADDFPAPWVAVFTDAQRRPLARDGAAAWRGSDAALSKARYLIDLDGMADAEDDYDSAKRSGHSVMVDLSGVVALPMIDGETADATLAIHFRAQHGGDVATALPEVDGSYRVAAREVDYAAAVVFGTFERRRIAVPLPLSLAEGEAAAAARSPQGAIELVVMGGPLAADVDEIADWVEATALANADLWRGFPVARSTVVILPTPGRTNVPFGRVIATGGIMVLVLVGSEIEARGLYDEWVLVHEFIHLGTPQIRDTGAWLNEGLATYLEPIIRYRAGWRSAESVWEEWTGWMGRGVAPMSRGLSGGRPYWGGALFALMADIELRQLTGVRMGLVDCLRPILAEAGDVSAVG